MSLIQIIRLANRQICQNLLASALSLRDWRIAGGSAKETRVVNLPADLPELNIMEAELFEQLETHYPVDCSCLRFAEAAIVRYALGAVVPPHTDVNPSKRDRVLSFIVYLTEGFDGGTFHVPSLNFSGIAPIGSAIIFPSTELHFADVIVSGDKSGLVGFLANEQLNAFRD